MTFLNDIKNEIDRQKKEEELIAIEKYKKEMEIKKRKIEEFYNKGVYDLFNSFKNQLTSAIKNKEQKNNHFCLRRNLSVDFHYDYEEIIKKVFKDEGFNAEFFYHPRKEYDDFPGTEEGYDLFISWDE